MGMDRYIATGSAHACQACHAPGHAPEPDVVQTLLDAAARYRPEFAAYLRLSVTTGARRGELCALRWTDIDLDGGEAVIAAVDRAR